jgi:hypothetical protein
MRTMPIRTSLFAVLTLLGASGAVAQAGPTVDSLVPGDRLRVTLAPPAQPPRVTGELLRLTPDSVHLFLPPRLDRTVARTSIRSIEVERKGPATPGGVLRTALVFGAVVWGVDRLSGALNENQYGDLSTGSDDISGATIFISGAAVGGLIQFFRGERRWVRVAPAN